MSTKALVTGSMGRVGRRVTAGLRARGYDVIGVDRRPPEADTEGLQLTVDLADAAALERELPPVDVVVHLAALMSWNLADTDALMSANVDATNALVHWAARHNVSYFALGSTGEVYPENHPVQLPVDEEHPTLPRTPYGLSKLLAEEIVRYAHRALGVPSTILRFEHTQDAAELLDPSSFFSGPRFFVAPRIERERSLGNDEMVQALEPHDTGSDRLLLLRDQDGRASLMPITDTRDLATGIIAAVERPQSAGNTLGIGPAVATDFSVALPRMADATGLDIAEVTVDGPLPNYETRIDRAMHVLEYRPAWSFERMIEDAAQARQQRAIA